MINTILDSNIGMINQIKNSIETTIANTRYSILKIAYNSSVEIFMTLYEEKERNIVEVINSLDRLNSKVAFNRDIASCFIYYKKENKVVDIYYERILNKDQLTSYGSDRAYLETNNTIINRIVQDYDYSKVSEYGIQLFNIQNMGENNIVFAKPIGGSDPEDANIILFVTIDGSYLDDLINSIKSESQSSTFIIDKNNFILAGNDDQPYLVAGIDTQNIEIADQSNAGGFIQKINDTEYLITFVNSENLGWRFYYFLPTESCFSSIKVLQIQILIIFSICLAFSLLIAKMLAGGFYSPIKRLIKSINVYKKSEDEELSNELVYLENKFKNLIKDNKGMEETINKNIPIIKNSLLVSLIQNNDSDLDNIWDRIQFYELSIIKDSKYLIFIIGSDEREISFETYTEPQLRLLDIYQIELIKKISNNYNGIHVQDVKLSNSYLVFILSADKNDNQQKYIYTFLQEVQSTIKEELLLSTVIGVGSIRENINEIKDSLSDANKAYEYRLFLGKGRIISLEDAPKQLDWVDAYPFKIEKQLLLHLIEADVSAVFNTLHEFFQILIGNRIKMQQMKYANIYLLDNIIKTCLEIGYSINDIYLGNRDLYKELADLNNYSDIQVWFKGVLEKIVYYIVEKRNSVNDEIVEKVLKYVSENFMMPDICMTSICDYFHYSQSFISKIFRETKYQTIKQYITEKRLEKAKELIEKTDMQINKISQTVGYVNTQSFLKIFKKFCGETPREYRTRYLNRKKDEN